MRFDDTEPNYSLKSKTAQIKMLDVCQNTIHSSLQFYSFICQGASVRRRRSDLCSLRVKLQPVTTTQR